MSKQTKKTTTIAMLTAIAAVLITLVHFPLFPTAAFLQYDPADVAILIGAFAYGPVAGVIITVLASFIQAFLLGGDGVYAADRENSCWMANFPARMVNTTGCGDSVMAAIVWAYLENLDLEDSVRAGLAAGSITLESTETISPLMSAEAIRKRMNL